MGIIESLFCFLIWLVGLVGWGAFADSQLSSANQVGQWNHTLLRWLVFGSCTACLFILLQGSFGALGPHWRWINWLWVWAGLAYLTSWTSLFVRGRRGRSLKKGRPHLIEPVLLSVIWVALLYQSSFLYGQGDPLYYHLVGPRTWYEMGGIRLPVDHPIALTASSWETLTLWGWQLMGTSPPHGNIPSGLIETQIFAQHVHASLGLVGLVLSMWAILDSLSPAKSRLTFWASLAVLGATPFGFFGILAKNDAGVAFWILSGVSLLIVGRAPGSHIVRFLGGLALGLGMIGKPTGAVFAVVLAGMVLIQDRRSQLKSWPWITGCAAGILLFAIRNFILTSNPVFPSVFSSPQLSKTMESFYANYRNLALPTLTFIMDRFKAFAAIPGVMVFVASSIWLFLVFVFKKTRPPTQLLTMVVCVGLGFLAYSAIVGGGASETRLSGPLLPFTCSVGAFMFFSLLEKFKIRWMIPPAALVIGQVPFVPYLRMAGGHKPAHETEARNHNGGMLKDWVRDHLPTNTLIATTGDNEVYYLSGWRVRVLYYHPDLDETRWKTYRATSEDGLRFLKDLKAKGYQYVLDVRGSNGKYFSTLSQAAELALAKNSKALLFRGPDVLGQIGFVADLNAL